LEGKRGLEVKEGVVETTPVEVVEGILKTDDCCTTTSSDTTPVENGSPIAEVVVSELPKNANTVGIENTTQEVDAAVFHLKDGPWATDSIKANHVSLNSSKVKVENTRMIKNRGEYTRSVVQECKNRFGRPERTAANVLAVRRYALDIMTQHGLRHTHISQQLPMTVELVFVRSAAEDEAEYLTETLRYADAHRGGFNWFRRTYHFFVGVSPTRSWY
jgi:hypothetical protein